MDEDPVISVVHSLPVNSVSGIYIILNLINNKFYVGSTVNFKNRRKAHLAALKGKRHYCRHLQRSFNLYGEQAFEFRSIEYCEEKELIYREQYWIDKFWNTEYLYNEYSQAHRNNYKSIGKEKQSRKKYPVCIVKGCFNDKNHGKFCNSHWSDYYCGIIDSSGNILRESKKGKKRYTKCVAKNSGSGECSSKLMGKFCTKHKNQYAIGIIDKEGKKLREIKKGVAIYPECLAKNAGTGECGGNKMGRFCKKHYGQFERGVIDKEGKKLRDLWQGKKLMESKGNL